VNVLSNTTIWWIDIHYLLHREQLHVSALGNGHLSLYMKHFLSSCTKHIYKLLIWGRVGVKWAQDLVSVLKIGWCGLHGVSMLLPSYV